MTDVAYMFLMGLLWGVFGTLSARAAFSKHRSLERSKRGARHPLKDVPSIAHGD